MKDNRFVPVFISSKIVVPLGIIRGVTESESGRTNVVVCYENKELSYKSDLTIKMIYASMMEAANPN